LKEEILARDGKLVIRPDSGNPVDILCGTFEWSPKESFERASSINFQEENNFTPEMKGVIELLWDVFGGTVNEQGYKVLDPHIGAIYGDSITIDRADEICRRLEGKGFASTNVVLGIGSFTYQYNTRDTFGFAMKATYVEVDGEAREIFKDPITDDGTKKSATGLLHVTKVMNDYVLIDKVTWGEEEGGELQTIYKDGNTFNKTTLNQIRERLKK
jgi:nicotinamide phosphoribosyltransferase